jgi:hypothetical protein
LWSTHRTGRSNSDEQEADREEATSGSGGGHEQDREEADRETWLALAGARSAGGRGVLGDLAGAHGRPIGISAGCEARPINLSRRAEPGSGRVRGPGRADRAGERAGDRIDPDDRDRELAGGEGEAAAAAGRSGRRPGWAAAAAVRRGANLLL